MVMAIVTAAEVAGLAATRLRGAAPAGWAGMRRERR
jgi:hypothetical protein